MVGSGGSRTYLVDEVGVYPRAQSRGSRILSVLGPLLLIVMVTGGVLYFGSDGDLTPAPPAAETRDAAQLPPIHSTITDLDKAASVSASEDAANAYDLSAMLFSEAPVVIALSGYENDAEALRGDSWQDIVDIAVANNVPILPVADREDFEAEVERLGSVGVLNVELKAEHGDALSVRDLDTHSLEVIDLATWDRDADSFQINDSWEAELAQNLGDLQPAESTPSTTMVTDTDLGRFPVTAATAEAAGAEIDAGDTIDLFAADLGAEELTGSLIAFSDEPVADESLKWQQAVLENGLELPGGGFSLFDEKSYVALYGSPDIPALGVLGQNSLKGSITEAEKRSSKYADLTEDDVIPTFEIIATVASSSAGNDGNYSSELPAEDLKPWVEKAGEEGFYVLIDLQSGRTDFVTQAKKYEELLKMPHVGLALDAEWRLEKGQKHLEQIGSVKADEINETSAWLQELVQKNELPPKMLVLHQFSLTMIKNRSDITVDYPEIDVVLHADGQGTQAAKTDTWDALHDNAPDVAAWGWKNFLKEDHPVLSPKKTYAVTPRPLLVTYQ